jgi:large subunit ribosomal protein L21
MFAVIKTGGKQYKVAPNDILRVEKLAGEPGETLALSSVLMLENEAGLQVGAPLVEGACVAAEVVEQTRGPKIIVFKKQRRKHHRKRNGHRQDLTVLRVTEILTDGKQPAPTKAKPAATKTPAQEPAAKKKAAKKAEPAKPAAPKKTAAKKTPAKKAAPKKAAAKKAPAKKAAPKKAAAKKSAKKIDKE